jgi:hypothetical protein
MVSQSRTTRVEKQLLRQQLHFTLTEAAALTGLSVDEAREALDPLLTKYVCRLQVSENGDLIYNFGPTLRRRGSKTFAEHRQEIVAWLWKAFTVVYKAWIALTLVVYFVIFLVILLLILLASSAKQSSDNRRRSSSIDLAPLLQMFIAIFQWRTVTGAFDYRHDRYGYRYRAYRPTPGALNTNRKNFVAAVYDFVFGPPRPVLDPLQNEKEVAAYLRQQKGLVVASELSALAGWTLPQAETFLTDCVIRYQGETKISSNAVLYGEFDTLIRGVGDGHAGDVVYYWDEYEPEYELTGNSAAYNGIIACMNGFNLLFALLVLSGSLDRVMRGPNMMHVAPEVARLAHGPFMPVVLGWLPLIFSVLFFVIPGVRLLRLQALRRWRRQQNVRKRLFKTIFARQGQPQSLNQLLALVNAKTQEETLSQQVVEERLQELTLDLAGDMTVNDQAEVVYAFPRMTRELREVEHLRQQRRVDTGLGGIIIESDNVVEPDV